MALSKTSERRHSDERNASWGLAEADPGSGLGESVGSELRRADRALCRLEGAVSALPDADAFTSVHLRDEAARSCMLAGDAATLADILMAEHASAARAASDAVSAATYCWSALQSSVNQDLGESISTESIINLHAILNGTGNESGNRGTTGRAAPVPSSRANAGRDAKQPARVALGDLSGELERLLQGDASLPAVARIGLAQASVERAQAFASGNARMGRLIVPVLLKQSHGVALGISRFLQGRSAEYRYLVESSAPPEGRRKWLEFFLGAVTESAARSADEIRQVVALRERHRSALVGNLGHAVGRGLRVLERLFRDPVATVAQVRAITGTSYVAANHLVSRLVQLGVIEEFTGYRRNRVFVYGRYLRVFDRDARGPVARQDGDRQESAEVREEPRKSPAPGRKRRGQPPVAKPPSEPAAKPRKSTFKRRRTKTLSDHLL